MSTAAPPLDPPVLVTGAFGQVGTLVTTALLERGHTVIALDLPTPAAQAGTADLMRRAAALPGVLIPVSVDITDPTTVRRVVLQHRPRAIIHLASVIPPACYRHPARAHEVNVEGTRHLVAAALELTTPPFFVYASSAAVYGSRNPHRDSGPVTGDTPVNPVDCYGADKLAAEQVITGSGLRRVILRLGGIMSPHQMASGGTEYLVIARATPRDNRVHMVDARDVALAVVHSLERVDAVDGRVLAIGGNHTFLHTHSDVQDEVFAALGLGRLGPGMNLPGDPQDDHGWGLTDWFDTTQSQRILEYQQHDWADTMAWLSSALGRRRTLIRALGPLARPLIRGLARAQQRWERRGPYADPWSLIRARYGDAALAPPSADAAPPVKRAPRPARDAPVG